MAGLGFFLTMRGFERLPLIGMERKEAFEYQDCTASGFTGVERPRVEKRGSTEFFPRLVALRIV